MNSLLNSTEIDGLPKVESPFLIRSVFWKSRHLDESPILEHLPFLFWLVSAQRPRLHVSLGVGDGVGYFSICQAIDRLEPEGRNVGIDSPSKIKRKAWEDISRINENFYSDNSKLIESLAEEFRPEFRKGSIDLLLIYNEISSKLSEQILENWLPCLSSRGIIVCHGVAHPGFGDTPGGPMLEKLRKEHPSIRFETGDGIEAILVGKEQNEFLRNFASLSIGNPSYDLVHAIFARLGAAHRFEWASRSNKTIARLAEARANHADVALSELQDKLTNLECAYAERSQRANELQATCFDMEQLAKKAIEEREKATDRNEALAQQVFQLEAALEDATKERDNRKQEVRELYARLTEFENQQSKASVRSEATKRFLASMETELTRFASTAHAQSRETSHLKTKLREAEIRLATRQEELSAANTRVYSLGCQLEALVLKETAKRCSLQVTNTQLLEKLETEREFIRALEPKLVELAKESFENKVRNTSLKEDCAELSKRYRDIVNSTSWAVTSPARDVVDWLRKLKP